MKILLITPYLPYRGVDHAGGKFIYDFIVNAGKKGVQVSLISFIVISEKKYVENIRSLCPDSVFILKLISFPKKVIEYFAQQPLLCAIKLFLSFFENILLRIRLSCHVNRALREGGFDIVQVEYSEMGIYLKKINFKKLKILDLHDVMIKPAEREYLAETNAFFKFLRGARLKMVRQIEVNFCKMFDMLLVKSAPDKEILSKYGNFKIEIMPLGVDTPAITGNFKDREAGSILFVGAMHRDLNEKAVIYFVKKVLPRLKKDIGNVKFYIAGGSPSRDLRRLSSENVIVTGYVDDLSVFYNRCRVFVAPLFVGGGMVFKILESMSFGLPVISTDIANEGIGAEDGKEILIANRPEEFYDRTVALLKDERLWGSISSQAEVFIKKRYSWDKIIDDYMLLCDKYRTL